MSSLNRSSLLAKVLLNLYGFLFICYGQGVIAYSRLQVMFQHFEVQLYTQDSFKKMVLKKP